LEGRRRQQESGLNPRDQLSTAQSPHGPLGDGPHQRSERPLLRAKCGESAATRANLLSKHIPVANISPDWQFHLGSADSASVQESEIASPPDFVWLRQSLQHKRASRAGLGPTLQVRSKALWVPISRVHFDTNPGGQSTRTRAGCFRRFCRRLPSRRFLPDSTRIKALAASASRSCQANPVGKNTPHWSIIERPVLNCPARESTSRRLTQVATSA